MNLPKFLRREPPPKLTRAQALDLLANVPAPPIFPGMPAMDEFGQPIHTKRYEQLRCQFCGGIHTGVCPRVQSISYQNGAVSGVTFFQKWDDRGVLFMHEILEASGSSE